MRCGCDCFAGHPWPGSLAFYVSEKNVLYPLADVIVLHVKDLEEVYKLV